MKKHKWVISVTNKQNKKFFVCGDGQYDYTSVLNKATLYDTRQEARQRIVYSLLGNEVTEKVFLNPIRLADVVPTVESLTNRLIRMGKMMDQIIETLKRVDSQTKKC